MSYVGHERGPSHVTTAQPQCSQSSKSSKSNGSANGLLGRCVLPAFRRRARGDTGTTNGTDIVTLDTRWSDAHWSATPLPPLPGSAAAMTMVESMSADFDTDAGARRLQQHARHGRTTSTSTSNVRKSRSLQSPAVADLSCLTSDLHVTSSEDVTSLAHSHQQRLLSQPSRDDDDDDENEKQRRAPVNSHRSVLSVKSHDHNVSTASLLETVAHTNVEEEEEILTCSGDSGAFISGSHFGVTG